MTDVKTFWHYRLHRTLGSGWLGTVYVASDLDGNGTELALRVLDEAHASQPGLLGGLERLLTRVNALQHPHLLPTGLLEQRDGKACYQMRLAAQGSLRQLLQQARSGIPLVTAVELGRQAASGLAYAHAQGVMHGNLKPENMLLQAGRTLLGQPGYTVQLADFGLAELRLGLHGTHDRAVVNSLAYTSPEQWKGTRQEYRTDLYTLGLILYELVTGMVPFDLRDAEDAYEKHLHVAPRQPSALRAEVPEALEEIILVCLAKRPEDRYASAQEVEAALQAVLNGMMPGGPDVTLHLPGESRVPEAPVMEFKPRSAKPYLVVLDERGRVVREDDLNGDTLTLGRAGNNAVRLEHAGVSRHHLSLEFRNGAAQVTDLGSTNNTLLDGAPLPAMTPTRWTYGSPLYVRPFWLMLVGPQETVVRPRIVVKPDVTRVTLVPGQPLSLNVLLANTGKTVDHFRLSVDGIPAAWVQNPGVEVQLNPGTQVSTALTLLCPRSSESRAGEYACTVNAHSREDAAQVGKAPLTVNVAPFYDLQLEVTPPVRRAWRAAKYDYVLKNAGNTDGVYLPTLVDDSGEMRLIVRPEDFVRAESLLAGGSVPRAIDPTQLAHAAVQQAALGARNVGQAALQKAISGEGRIRVTDLPPALALKAGERHAGTFRATVPIRWVGQASTHSFSIPVSNAVLTDGPPVATARAELQHVPVIPMWLFPVLLLLVGVGIWWLLRPPAITDFALAGTDTAVAPGKAFDLRWATSNARAVSIEELPAQAAHLSGAGTLKVPGIASTQKYTLKARNLIGLEKTRILEVPVTQLKPVIEVFTVTPRRVSGNQPVKVTWKVRNADQISISGVGRNLPPQGSREFVPLADTSVKLQAANGPLVETAEETVSVTGAEIKVFKASKEAVPRGSPVRITWLVTDAVTVKLNGETVPLRSEKVVTLNKPGTFTLSAQGSTGAEKTAQISVDVTSLPPQIVKFVVSPQQPKADQKVTISWQVKNASTVMLMSDASGARTQPSEGSIRVDAANIASQVVLTASNADGVQDTKSADVTVVFPPPVQNTPAALSAAAGGGDTAPGCQPQPVTFTADPPEILGKGDVNLTWNAPCFNNVSILPLRGPRAGGLFEPQGAFTVKDVNTTRTFTLYIKLRNGKAIRIPRTVKVTPLPAEVRAFMANPTSLNAPGQVVLSWEVANASAVKISGVPGPWRGGYWPPKGQTLVRVSGSKTFTLSAGKVTADTAVVVNAPTPPPTTEKPPVVTPPPTQTTPQIRSFSVTPASLRGPGSVTVQWDVANAASVKIDGLDGALPPRGQKTVNVTKSQTFTLRAGNTTQTKVVTLVPRPVTINYFTVAPGALSGSGKVSLNWSVSNASSVKIDGLSPSNRPASGSALVDVSKTTTFTLTAGGQSKAATVTVTAVPQARIRYFTASPLLVQGQGSVTLAWDVANATSVKIDGVDGIFPAKGQTSVNVSKTQTFVLRAGNASMTKTVSVVAAPKPVTINYFTAAPGALSGPGKVSLNWDVANATSVRIDGLNPPTRPARGSALVDVSKSTTFTLTAGGQSRAATVNVQTTTPPGTGSAGSGNTTPAPAPRIVSFTASPTTVQRGQTVTLSWQVENAPSVTIKGVQGVYPPRGSATIQPTENTTLELRAGTSSQSLSVNVTEPVAKARVVSFTATPSSVTAGEKVTLAWQVEGVQAVKIEGLAGLQQASGSAVVVPPDTRTFTIDINGAKQSVTVNVTPKPAATVTDPARAPRIVSFTVTPTTIKAGETVTLEWEVENTDNVKIKGIKNLWPPKGHISVAVPSTRTFELQAGEDSRSVTVTVTP